MKTNLKAAARLRDLSASTALGARFGLATLSATVVFLAPPALAQDAKDYVLDSGSVVWTTNQSFADDMIIGLENKGVSATITDGAKVLVANRGIIAGLQGSQATVTVSGSGSELNVLRTPYVLGNTLTIGGGCNGYSVMCIYGGDGTLNIENGGKVDAKKVLLADTADARGTLRVTGAGSTLTTDTLTTAAGPAGSITVDKGGSIQTGYSAVGFSATDGVAGVRIIGAGSNWTNTGQFDIGSGGALTVSDGGLLQTSGATVDSSSELLVTGANSSIKIGDKLTIGGEAQVLAADGGHLDVGNTVVMEKEGFLVVGGRVDTSRLAGDPVAIDTRAAGTINSNAVISFGKSGSARLVFNHTNSGYEFANKLTGNGSIATIAGETIMTGDLTGFSAFDNYAGGVIVDGGSKLVIKGDIGTNVANTDNVVPDRNSFQVKNGTLTIGGETGKVVTNFLGSEVYTSNFMLWGDQLNSARNMLGGHGRLAGFGSVGSTYLDTGASISPGDAGSPIGTLNVYGDLGFDKGSIYEVDVAGNGQSDRLAVHTLKQYGGVDENGVTRIVDGLGRATIETGTSVQVTALDAATSYQNGQTYTILTADGGIKGSFGQAVSKSAFLDVALDQSEKQIDLKIAVKDVSPPVEPPPVTPEPPPVTPEPPPVTPEPPPVTPEPSNPGQPNPGQPSNPGAGLFDSVAETSNQTAVARSLNTLQQSGESLALYNNLLLLSADEARGAFDQLSGEAIASTKSALMTTSRVVRDAANDRMRSASGDVAAKPVPVLNYWDNGRWAKDDPMAAVTKAPTDPMWSAWGQTFGLWSELDARDGSASMDVATGGFISGIDALVAEDTRLGVFVGYSRTSADVNDRSSSADSDDYHFGIYGSTQWDAISLRSGMSYSVHDISRQRSVNFPGVSQQLNADYDAGSLQFYGELGYKIETEMAALEPFINLAHVRLQTDRFSETGGSAALTSSSDTLNTTFTTLGMRASSDFDLGGINAVASGTLGWRHAFGDTDPASRLAFAGSDSYTVRGAPITENAFIVQVGLDIALSSTATFGVSYNGEFGGDGMSNGVDAKLNVRF